MNFMSIFLRLCIFVFSSSVLLVYAYPKKILIKNATDEAITYALDVRYKNGVFHRVAFVWLEPNEEQDINKKYFLGLEEIPDEINYLSIAINMEKPSDMLPFSKTDAHEVKFGKYKAVRIMVRKDKVGSLYHKVSPIYITHKKKLQQNHYQDRFS
jgi:hypothetical protein